MNRYNQLFEGETEIERKVQIDLNKIMSRYKSEVNLQVYADYEGNISLKKIVIPKEQRNKGLGTIIIKDIIKIADKYNVITVLTPSKDFGGSKTKLIPFYKRFGFVMNKGRNKDYKFRDTMYRKSI